MSHSEEAGNAISNFSSVAFHVIVGDPTVGPAIPLTTLYEPTSLLRRNGTSYCKMSPRKASAGSIRVP